MRPPTVLLTAAVPGMLAAAEKRGLRPPLWSDADDRPIEKPRVRDDQRDLFEIVHHSWIRHLSPSTTP